MYVMYDFKETKKKQIKTQRPTFFQEPTKLALEEMNKHDIFLKLEYFNILFATACNNKIN